jgi:hypothetical protein
MRRGVIVHSQGTFGEDAHRYYLSAIDATGATYTHGGKVAWPQEAGPRVIRSASRNREDGRKQLAI